MSRFAADLREISERVNLPQPARARILTEMAGDLEDLYEVYLGRGLSEDEAARQALDHLDLSDETMRELARVHGGWFRRLSDSVAERAGTPWEKALLGVLVLGTIGLSGAVVQAVPMSRAAGPWLVPITCVAFVTLGIGVWKSYVLFLRGDHRPRRLRKGLGALLGTTLLQLFLAFSGLGFTALSTLRAIGVEPAQAGILTMRWLQGALALLDMSLSLALVGGVLWFFLLGKVASIEHDEAASLLGG